MIEWYIARAHWMLAGACIFFVVLTIWAGFLHGRSYFVTELGMYITAAIAFATRAQWAYALLSVVVWAHIIGIAYAFLNAEEGRR